PCSCTRSGSTGRRTWTRSSKVRGFYAPSCTPTSSSCWCSSQRPRAMRSSTSSSKPPERRGPRLDRRVLLLVFAALLVVELGVRVIEPRLSLDIRHIQAIPDIVSDVHESAGPSVVFFGNSLTRAGVDLGVMASGLAPAGVERGGVAAVYPDDTTILDWIYVYEHYLARPDLE